MPFMQTSAASESGTADDDDDNTDDDDDDDSDADDDDDDDDGSSSGDDAADTDTTDGGSESSDTGSGSDLDPPAGASSGGSGGGATNGDVRTTPSGVTYRVIAPGGAGPLPAMIVYSGTEGGATMTSNLLNLQGPTGTSGTVFAVLDGVDYNGNGGAGADVLDSIRSDYDIDNDRTYLLSESAGTSAGLQLGLSLRQSYFAAFWANDVNTSAAPMLTADDLGFAPWGNAGPGGDFPDANAIVDGMEAAGYRLEQPAPYNGPGSDTHGDIDQFIAALSWFPGRTRQ